MSERVEREVSTHNWIVRTLRAAHDKQFRVEICYGSNCTWVGGLVREIDDETLVLETSPAFGCHDFVVRISAICGICPYPEPEPS